MLAEPTIHDLSHSSQPTSAEPTFQPIAIARAKTSDEALERLAVEVIDLAAREDAAYDRLADLPSDDPEQSAISAEAKRLEENVRGRLSMAALVRADTPAGLAAKGRAVLAYRKTLDGCVVDEAQPLLISMAEDAVNLARPPLSIQDDAALLSIGRRFEAQWRQERTVARAGSDEEIKFEMDRTQDLVNRIRDLPATTPAGWKVKARVIAWTCSCDFSDDCLPDVAMVASLLRDLGAIDGPTPTFPVLPDADHHLLALKRPFDEAWAVERATAAAVDSTGGSEALEAHERAGAATSALTRQIESFPATSLEGLKLKAAALSSLYPGEEITSECIAGRPGRNATDMRLIVQIIRDLRAMVDEPGVALPAQAAAVEHLEQAA